MARGRPIRRASAWMVAIGGMNPMLISGWPSRASDAAKRRSQCRVISSPPPTAVPLMAASSGLGEPRSRRTMSWQRLAQARMPLEDIEIGAGAEIALDGARQHHHVHRRIGEGGGDPVLTPVDHRAP